MRKALIAVIAAAALFAVGAFAAELTVQSDNLASGQGAVAQCGAAQVEWTTDTTAADNAGDWSVTAATVSFANNDCDGATVDLAVGINTDGTGTADTWEDWTCGDVDETSNAVLCTADGDDPDVSDVVEVAVLANGNSIEATVLP